MGVGQKLHVKSGDRVKIIAGDDKGKTGRVIRTLPREGRVVVEGVNVVKRHTRPTREMMQGGIIDKEAPIDVSNVALICPRCGEPARTGRMRLEDGRWVRQCKKCEEVIDD